MNALGDMGELQVRALLNILIVDAVLFFNVGKSMNKAQVIQTVDLVMDDYKHFKPEDFKLCFKNAAKGHYNPAGLFDRLDGQVIIDWLTKYDCERDMEIEAIRSRENKELKKQWQQNFLPVAGLEKLIGTDAERYAEIAARNIEKLKADRLERKRLRDEQLVAKAAADKDKGPVWLMHQRWLQQFADIALKQHTVGRGLVRKYGMMQNPFYRAGSIDGQPKQIPRELDVNEYLQHKQWQYEMALQPRDERLKIYLKGRKV